MSKKKTFPETSIGGPWLLNYHNEIYIGWTGENFNIYVGIIQEMNTINNVTQLWVQSNEGPSLAIHDDKIYVAWRSVENHRINTGCFDGSMVVRDRFVDAIDVAIAAPSIASHNKLLYIAWPGVDNKINLATIESPNMTKKTILEETSMERTFLISEDGELKVAWIGIDYQHHLNLASLGSTEVGRIQGKQVFKVPYTEDVTLHIPHKIPTLHIHPYHGANLRIHRSGISGVRYCHGFFAVSVNYSIPEWPHQVSVTHESKNQYDEYKKMNHSIYLYHT